MEILQSFTKPSIWTSAGLSSMRYSGTHLITLSLDILFIMLIKNTSGCYILVNFIKYQCVNSLRPSDAYICVSKLTIICSDNGLSPGRRQAIIWTNAWILLIEPLGTNFSEILIGIQILSFKKMRLKMTSGKWRPFCLGLNVLNTVKIVASSCIPTGWSPTLDTNLFIPSQYVKAPALDPWQCLPRIAFL